MAGQLIIGGFAGTTLTPSFARALASGERGGAILFRRNLSGSLDDIAALCRSIREAAPPKAELPTPIVGVDEEGGRVARLPRPALLVPPARAVARAGGPLLVAKVARAKAAELRALGFTMNFAPVLDVHTRDSNPVIGDRAFSSDPHAVAACAEAYLRALDEGGVLACGKHFPGHGDTTVDSHLELPAVDHDRARLDAVELVPFRHAVRAGIASLMTAHVVCRALDPERPATLSRTVVTELLRDELRFDGVLVCDDLEMKAISERHRVENAAVEAIRAGCDALLICEDEAAQARALEALVREAERDATMRDRLEEAYHRVITMRLRHPPPPRLAPTELERVFATPERHALAAELARVGAA